MYDQNKNVVWHEEDSESLEPLGDAVCDVKAVGIYERMID